MTLRRIWPVLALAAVLGVAHAIATPAFWPVDETAHVAYADHLLAEGALPEVDTPIPTRLPYPGLDDRLGWERAQHREGRQDIWTSNHPPLPYLIQGVALRLGSLFGGGLAVGLARLTSTLWLVAGVWLTMLLAHSLAPRQGEDAPRNGMRTLPPDAVAYAAGALVATTPTLSHLGGLVFNDVPAFTLSTACLLVGVRIAMRGLDTRRLLLLGVVAGATALTRVSALPAVGVAVLLLAYGAWRHPIGVPAVRRSRVLLATALPLLPAVWFWLRNTVLYGDPTASAELLGKFDRDVNAPVAELLVDRFFWLRMWNRMLADLTTGHWAVGTRASLTEVLLLAVVAGLTVMLWRMRTHGSPASWLANPRAVCWVACLLLPAALLVSAVQFHSAGGSLHGRYLLGGHAVTATVIIVVLAQLPRVGRLVGLAFPVVLLWVNSMLLQALLLHHAVTWTRPGIRLVLPRLLGTSVGGAVWWCTVIAGGLLALSLHQHLIGVPGDVDTPAPRPRGRGRYGVAPPKRPIRESAAA